MHVTDDTASDKKTHKAGDSLFESRQVLDKGFVRLVDYMGSDQRIVQSARVSYGAGTKTAREDRGLICYLLRNAHTSPFEQVVFTFHVKMPIFVARQWVRHRTARLNEISGRYSLMEDEFYVPDGNDINAQSEYNKQARVAEPLPRKTQDTARALIEENQQRSYKEYLALLGHNIARELARVTLPAALYTQMYWQIDLHNLFHFLRLRMDAHAQKEIRDYAHAMFEIIKAICPLACEAFEDYVLNKIEWYRAESAALALLLSHVSFDDKQIKDAAKQAGLKTQREQNMFAEKLACLIKQSNVTQAD